MIEKEEIQQSVEELNKSGDVKIQIELSAWEAYSLVVAAQFFENNRLSKIEVLGKVTARKLHGKLKNSCSATYKLLDNGWKLGRRVEGFTK